jgi:GYF domain 2
MAATDRRWYLSRDGQQYGPFSDSDLARFQGTGQLQPTDLVWREGLADWRPAADLLGSRDRDSVRAQPTPAKRKAASNLASTSESEQFDVWRRRAIISGTALLCAALVGAVSGFIYRLLVH